MTAVLTGCPGEAVDGPWRSPDAALLLRADAPRELWLQHRRTGLGSSDASTVVGVNRWSSPYELWCEKRGLLPEQPDNDAMELGRLLEPIVVDHWSATTGIPIRRAGLMQSLARPWQLASVDRLAACGGIVEAKTLSWRVAEEWEDGQTPDHAEVQVQHQLAVTGRSHAHVVGLQDGRTWLERTVVRDDALIADLGAVEARFWELVQAGVEPPIDWTAATTDALAARWRAVEQTDVVVGERLADLVAQRRDAKTVVAGVERRLAELDNEIRALLGENTEGWVEGPDPDDKKAKPLVTWRRNGAFSPAALAASWPDLAAELTGPVEVERLDIDRLKADHPEIYAACRARVLRVANPKKETP
ncbi:YqaJ viral recombinase family protein [Klenkia sp. LSe6-5]|uniref:YqaJ viral recombinase family protein n=1 Tax=Klenkia sesuvii TaxID=3103137 RepID=A0ABU8E0U6_9ACTN